MKGTISRIFLLYFSLFIFLPHYSQSLELLNTFHNVIKSGVDVTTGAVSSIPNVLPSTKDLLQKSKNLLAGYPFQYLFSAINHLCSVALSQRSVQPIFTPDIYKMTFIYMTPTKNYSFPLIEAETMWLSPVFDKNKMTVILVTGWQTDLNDTNGCIYTVSNAYFCRGNVNFVVVDTARFVDTLYSWSAFNTAELGTYIGQALVLFSQYADINNIHLIGHSLGAHIVGVAGRTFTSETQKILPRITGLDPANPCFNEGETLSGLQRGDAFFIDVIHSNPGALGKESSVGDVDFYPGGMNPLPAGCVTITCAHSRAWEYYAETVIPGYENNFMSIKCSSLSKLKSGQCIGMEIPMGYDVPITSRGNYFLEVNGMSPYGKNSTGKWWCNKF